jgi:hypothetical protein
VDPRTFIKSSGTSTRVDSSKQQLEAMLRRYGASSFLVSHEFTSRRSSISFTLPNDPKHPSALVPVRLDVETDRVARLLFPRDVRRLTSAQYDQAERVAWRNLLLWVDAALSAASIGLQTITEAFFAHTVVGPAGERMMDLVGAYQSQLGAGVQRLLTSNADVTD